MDAHDQAKPIPAYYCCYLLRSTVRHASLYIGSTPNPIRRLSQHNGEAKGGAKRTARDRLRPWEMVLLVEGFMNRVGALQFEWAWQHTQKSRHVELDDELCPRSRSKVIVDPRTGKSKPRAARSRRSLTAHLEDLHSLLRSAYFSSWPLRVRFFCADVYRVWRVLSERVDGRLPKNIRIISDGDCPKPTQNIQRNRDDATVGSISGLPVDYTRLEAYLEKTTCILDEAADLRCNICDAPVIPHREQIVVCPHAPCQSANHLLCLSARFLSAADESDRLIPTHGVCPACQEVVQWPVMMQELSFRNRAEKMARAMLKRKEKRDRKEATVTDLPASEDKSSRPRLSAVGTPSEDRSQRAQYLGSELTQDDPQLEDNWFEEVDLESDSDYEGRLKTRSGRPPSKLEIVIEDSEWDDAELVE